MARARNIKPGFFRDAALVELPVETRLLFPGLWTIADREGRLEDKPKQIKMEIYPADSFDVESMLCQLSDAGLILRYEAQGKRYIQIKNFSKHQNPHKDERASTIPAPCEHGASTVQQSGEHDGNPADSLNLIPDSLNLTADSRFSDPPTNTGCDQPAAESRPRKAGKKKSETPTTGVWQAYAAAYELRYGVEPVRNAKVNGQLAQLVQRLGAVEAPPVAAHYVRHNKTFYVAKKHPVDLLLADAEGLRTEWATNRTVTDTEARQADRTQTNKNAFAGLIEEAERSESASL